MVRFRARRFFGSIPEALRLLRLDKASRPSCHLRARRAPACRSGRRLLPVRSAPLGAFLAHRGSGEPRSWISGMAQRLKGSLELEKVERWRRGVSGSLG